MKSSKAGDPLKLELDDGKHTVVRKDSSVEVGLWGSVEIPVNRGS